MTPTKNKTVNQLSGDLVRQRATPRQLSETLKEMNALSLSLSAEVGHIRDWWRHSLKSDIDIICKRMISTHGDLAVLWRKVRMMNRRTIGIYGIRGKRFAGAKLKPRNPHALSPREAALKAAKTRRKTRLKFSLLPCPVVGKTISERNRNGSRYRIQSKAAINHLLQCKNTSSSSSASS